MESKQFDPDTQCSLVFHDDLSEFDNTLTCPLCNTQLKLYQINNDEKFLMCGNIYCVYPFGVADYHLYKVHPNKEFKQEQSNAASLSSSSIKSNCESSELLSNIHSVSLVEKLEDMEKLDEAKKSVKNEQIMKKNVKKIKELNKELFDDQFKSVDDGKSIQHIAEMQERTGIPVLKEHELRKVKKTVPTITSNLKIDLSAAEIAINIEANNE